MSTHTTTEREQAVLLPRFGVSERLAHWLLAAAFATRTVMLFAFGSTVPEAPDPL